MHVGFTAFFLKPSLKIKLFFFHDSRGLNLPQAISQALCRKRHIFGLVTVADFQTGACVVVSDTCVCGGGKRGGGGIIVA